MRIVFMGTPFFATKVLDTLIAGGHSVLGVYTQPDKKSGRGRQLINPPVKQYALEKGCLLYTSSSPRDGLLSRMPSSA